MRNNKYLLIIVLLLNQNIYAYIDPGSGSMLLSAIIGLIATIFYSIKGIYYKLKIIFISFFGIKADTNNHKLVFYSEGDHYWNSFKSTLESLDKKGVKAIYLSSSKSDPGLNFNSKNIKTRYIGKGNKAYAYLNILEADLFVTTTPGLDVSQIHRSKGVKHYSYISHSPIDMGKYKLYSFDRFDSIFLSGAHQEKSIHFIESLRRIKSKKLINAGCPYMDDLGHRLSKKTKNITHAYNNNQSKTVLIAPTWGKNNLLRFFNTEYIKTLLKNDYKIIIRPHPQSLVSEPDIIDNVKKDLACYDSVEWDLSADNFESLFNSDILISDLSGIVFDFAFVFEKPVITIDFDHDFLGYEANDFTHELWEIGILNKIGKRVSKKDFSKIPEIVKNLINYQNNNIGEIRNQNLFNYKKSGEVISRHLINILEEI